MFLCLPGFLEYLLRTVSPIRQGFYPVQAELVEFLQLCRLRSQVCRVFINTGDSMDINVVEKFAVPLDNLLNSSDKWRDGGVLFYAEVGTLRRYLLEFDHDDNILNIGG